MDSDKHQHVSITNSQVQVVPSATGASMTFSGPQRSPDAQSSPLSSVTCHLHITHDAVGVPALIVQARRHIVLHAAYYPKYGMDQQGKVLWNAMKNNPKLHLTVIFADIRDVSWAEEFARVLRPFYTAEDFQADLDFSKRHFTRCLKEFGPKRVSIIDTPRLPMFPIIMIDNTLVVGHYAHSEEIAPDGLWFSIHHPKISLMYESLLAGNSPLCETPEEKALIRYIHEVIVETVSNDKEKIIPAKPKPKPEPEPRPKAKNLPKTLPKPNPKSQTELKPQPQLEPKPKPKSLPRSQLKSLLKSLPGPHPKSQQKPLFKYQPMSEEPTPVHQPNIGNDIIIYVNRARPLLSDSWKAHFLLLWDNIIRQPEVEKVIYEVGRQRNTNFNRNLVANILHYLNRYGVYKDAYIASAMARCIETDSAHPVRAALSEYPPRDIMVCIDKMMDFWRQKL